MQNPMRTPNRAADCINLSGNAQATLSVSTTAADTAALPGGLYDLWCDVDVYIKVASAADDVTTSTGYLLRANTTLPNVYIPNAEVIGGILASGTGTLSYHKVG